MSPLETARQLSVNSPIAPYPDEECWRCMLCVRETPWAFEAVPEQFFHEEDCPWLAMPKIVAALEATQSLVDAHAQLGLWRVVDDPKELGDRQQSALTRLWEIGIRPSDPMQSAIEG